MTNSTYRVYRTSKGRQYGMTRSLLVSLRRYGTCSSKASAQTAARELAEQDTKQLLLLGDPGLLDRVGGVMRGHDSEPARHCLASQTGGLAGSSDERPRTADWILPRPAKSVLWLVRIAESGHRQGA